MSEQAVLTLTVVDANGVPVAIAQDSSSIGGTRLGGGTTKSVRYVVLVPRVLDISLALAVGSDYESGKYTIRVSAVDPDGNRTSTTQAVRVPESLPVSGTAGNDEIRTGDGDDAVNAGRGNDRVVTGSGDNRIDGGPGRDVFRSGGGADFVNVRDRERDLVNAAPGATPASPTRSTCSSPASASASAREGLKPPISGNSTQTCA